MIKKLVVTVFALLSLNAFAISIPVTEGMLNSQVSKSFPKTVNRIELSNPKITLLDGKSMLCIEGIPRIMFLDKPFKACASFKPVWNEKDVSLEATHLELIDIEMKDVGSPSPVIKGILNEVMIGIEPLLLYKSDSWLLKQISTIEVTQGMLYLKF